MRLRIYPDPILTEVCKPVAFPNRELVFIASRVRLLCQQWKGYSIAGPQIGIAERFFVLAAINGWPEDVPWFVANPTIVDQDGELTYNESCLSMPGFFGMLTRPDRVTIRYQNEAGDWKDFTASGVLGRVLQHEIDHLDGVLFHTRLDARQRMRAHAWLASTMTTVADLRSERLRRKAEAFAKRQPKVKA
jgi:peptide deformylase